MLTALLPLLAADAVVAVAADKGQTIAHEAYQRLDKFRVGKRQVAILSRSQNAPRGSSDPRSGPDMAIQTEQH
jgi:hypothetical protein